MLRRKSIWIILAVIVVLGLCFGVLWRNLFPPVTSPPTANQTPTPILTQTSTPIPTQTSTPTAALTPTASPTWKLAFDDEFDGTYIDTSKWNVEDKSSGGYRNCCLNYGVQYYTPQALSLSNGSLDIITQKQAMGGYSYTSGAITTENKFSLLYGRIDIRAKLPKTQGFWPAFWLIPDNTQGFAPFEIDIMELLGKDPGTIHMANHWGKQQTIALYKGSDFSQNYHVFSLIWNSQTITWYIDGNKSFQVSQNISDESMYLIINSTLGGRWPGNPDASTVVPQQMQIDYVRIYQAA